MAEPHSHHHSSTLNYCIVAASTGVANALSWAQSLNAGTIATGITIVGSGVIGFIVLWLQKVGPAWVEYKTIRDAARNGSLVGQMERLTEALDEAKDREADLKEGQAVARQLAADARELAEVNRRRTEKSDRRNAELMDQLAQMSRRLEDANKKLHEISSPIQATMINTKLAAQSSDEILARLDRNADLTKNVDGKADHIAVTVDHIAGNKSGEEWPAVNLPVPPAPG